MTQIVNLRLKESKLPKDSELHKQYLEIDIALRKNFKDTNLQSDEWFGDWYRWIAFSLALAGRFSDKKYADVLDSLSQECLKSDDMEGVQICQWFAQNVDMVSNHRE